MAEIYGGRGLSVAMTGASGMVGAALSRNLRGDGHRVVPLVRRAPRAGEIAWNPADGRLDPSALEGIDAVIHLAGESIAAGRWTRDRKRRILESRTRGTSLLARAIAGLERPPRVLVSMSAVGIYGDRGDEILADDARPGNGFLADVATAWEGAAEPARAAGIRVIHPRLAAVVSASGGLLDRLLLPFRMGLGGPIGAGAQWMPLVSLDDVIGAIRHLIESPALAGAFNVSLPTPVTNRQFSLALGRALRRPAIIPVPPAALRLLYGDLADELLIASERVVPAALEASGYRFRHPTLEATLEAAVT